jgi:ribonuclease E
MAKKMLIDATHAEETRVVVVDGTKVEEFDFESVNKRQLAGNIYLAKVTRVEPSLQAAFVDYGGNRHGFLAFSEIHPDYYQIPVADREALLAEERALARAEDDDEKPAAKKPRRSRRKKTDKPETGDAPEAVTAEDGAEAAAPEETAAAPEADADAETPAEDDAETPARPQAMAMDGKDKDPVTTSDDSTPPSIPGMDVVDLGSDEEDEAGDFRPPEAEIEDRSSQTVDKDEIESVAEEDVSEEIAEPRRVSRARKYKIQEVIKVRQIMLVQVVKEERGNKGAALTTYLSLAGRYCVLMPNTARGGGISRKITNAADRKKLKEIAQSIEVPDGAGLIVRTAGAQRTKAEIKRDYEYLLRLWEQIRDLTLRSIAPAPIYEEGNLIKRSIRDLYSREIDEVLVEGDEGYRTAKDFMKMLMPSHAKNVRHYQEPMPLFARFQVESYLSSMFNPVVQLKSGGYIVIGITEALVAIDVNSGRATKEGSIEETALKTNLEAADEVARQLRLRDLAGLIVIDFIDMEERKNNAAVEKRFKERLKTDRARIQVGRISGFGLLEMSRQRLRPGMLEATTQPCPACHGTGLIRSDDSLGLSILRQLEEEGVRKRSREVLLKAPVAIINFLMNVKREHIAQIEARYGMAIRLEADPHLIAPDFSIERFKTATRVVPEPTKPVISIDTEMPMDEVEEDLVEDETETDEAPETPRSGEEDGDKPKKKRRRRRRGCRRSGEGDERSGDGAEDGADDGSDDESDDSADAEGEGEAQSDADGEDRPKKKRRSRRGGRGRRRTEGDTPEDQGDAEADSETPEEPVAAAAEAPAADPVADAPVAEAPAHEPEPVPEAVEAPVAEPEVVADVEPEPAPEPQPDPVPESAPPAAETSDEPPKPKKRGWWSRG